MRLNSACCLVSALLAGCGWMPGAASSDDPEPLGVTRGNAFWLSPGQTARTPDGAMLTFEALVEDSRCPPAVTCVWGGVARVSVVPSEPGVRYAVPARLALGDLRADDRSRVGPFRLLDLHPYPRADGRAEAKIPRAQFIIE